MYRTIEKWLTKVASGGGTGRATSVTWLLGPASYGMTDTMGRMHGDAQFAGSSSVPARRNDEINQS